MFLLCITIFLICLSKQITNFMLQDQFELSKCVEKLIQEHFAESQCICYFHTNNNLPTFPLNISKISLENPKNFTMKLQHKRHFDGYILVVNEGEIRGTLENLYWMKEWNSRSKFLLVYDGNITSIMEILIKYYVYNIIILKVENLNLYTYYPYKYENFNTPETEPELIGNCDSHNDLYIYKVPKLWRNSTIRVAYYQLFPFIICTECGTGLEVQIVDMMHTAFQSQLVFSNTSYEDWGSVYPNGTYNGVLGGMQSGDAHFVIGHFHLRKPELLEDFDFTFNYMEDDVCFAVPKAKLRSHWENIMHIFNMNTWLAFAGSMVVSVFAWYFMAHKAPGEHIYNRQMVNSVEMALVNIFGLPVLHEPTSTAMRVLFLSISIFCFIAVNGWKAYLINSLTHETEGFQIETLEDLVESNIIIGIHPELRGIYKVEGTPEATYIYDHANDPCDAGIRCMDRTAFDRDMASMGTKKMFGYLFPQRYRDTTGRDLIYLFKKCLLQDHTMQFYIKGHPIYPKANNLLMWLKHAGIIDNIEVRLTHNLSLENIKRTASASHFGIDVLGLRQMQGSFYCLIGGLGFALLVFILELGYYQYFERIKRIITFKID